MFETGIRQFRMAMGMIRGRRLDTRNIGRLVGDEDMGEIAIGAQGNDLAGGDQHVQ